MRGYSQTLDSRDSDLKWPNGHRDPPGDAISEMPGDVLMVPDALFNIEAVGRSDHPGACVEVGDDRRIVYVSKGTDGHNLNWRYRANYVLVDANEAFGLRKLTAFSKHLSEIKFHKIIKLYPERHIGRLSHKVLEVLQKASERGVTIGEER